MQGFKSLASSRPKAGYKSFFYLIVLIKKHNFNEVHLNWDRAWQKERAGFQLMKCQDILMMLQNGTRDKRQEATVQ